jgi:hypothetical protein
MWENAALCIVARDITEVTGPPHCCAFQCLPRNLATHGAERSEGRRGAAQQPSAVVQLHSSRLSRYNSSRMGRMCHNIKFGGHG